MIQHINNNIGFANVSKNERMLGIASFIFVVSAVSLLMPVYAWNNTYIIYIIAYIVGIICLLTIIMNQKTLENNMIIVSMFYLILVVWQLLPFRSNVNIGYGGKVIGLFLVIFFIYLSDDAKRKIFSQIQIIFGILGLASFFVVLFLALGTELPYHIMNYNRGNPGEFFFLYPGAVIAMGKMTAFDLPTGGVLVRSSGIFAEPGHFGVICGILLAANGFSIGSIRNKMILLGGISTFSGSFYLIMFLCLLVKPISGHRLLSKSFLVISTGVILFFTIMILLFINSPIEFQNRALWGRIDQIQNIEDLTEHRAVDEFNDFFNTYKTSLQSMIGVGTLDEMNIRASDWRGEVARYGWPIILFYFIFYFLFFMASRKDKTIKLPLSIALAVVAFHRVSYIDSCLVIVIVASALLGDTKNVRIHQCVRAN